MYENVYWKKLKEYKKTSKNIKKNNNARKKKKKKSKFKVKNWIPHIVSRGVKNLIKFIFIKEKRILLKAILLKNKQYFYIKFISITT